MIDKGELKFPIKNLWLIKLEEIEHDPDLMKTIDRSSSHTDKGKPAQLIRNYLFRSIRFQENINGYLAILYDCYYFKHYTFFPFPLPFGMTNVL